MKAILISIRPQWVELILNGIKKDEIRKGTAIGKAINKLIKEQGVAHMLIYCTKGKDRLVYDLDGNIAIDNKHYAYGDEELNGKVVARFNATAEEINAINLEKFAKDSCLTIRELEDYLWSNILSGTAIHINNLEIFDKPKEISEFNAYCKGGIKCLHCKHYWTDDSAGYSIPKCSKRLTRAPQSWCYIEI